MRSGETRKCRTECVDKEIRRANARLRHFRGIAACMMRDAKSLLEEIRDELQKPALRETILRGKPASERALSETDLSSLLEKLHLLGIHIDCAKRLCEGTIGSGISREGDR